MSRRAAARRPEVRPDPQPEHEEPRLRDPGLTGLSRRDYLAVARRAVRETLADGMTDAAGALAYYSSLALPSLLLLSLGAFGLVAGRGTVESIIGRLDGVVPDEALTLVRDSLNRVVENQSGGMALIAVGALVALWSATGAMNALMRALNRAYEYDETRGFVARRLTGLAMLACVVVALCLTFGLLVLGPHVSRWVGDATGLQGPIGWIWWTAQWPILCLGVLAALAGVYYLGPNVDHPRFRFLTPGALVALAVGLLASGAFAYYASSFGSYNKAWGSLAAVVILLTWLWLTSLAVLVGAEIDAEAERSRELRRGEVHLQAPPKG